MMPMSREIHFPAAAVAALAKGQRIEAIKLLREANQGIDLRGAMEAVDAYTSGKRDFSIGEPLQPAPLTPKDQFPAEAMAAVSRGQLIEAIKIVRERHGLGLKEAKDLVDRYRGNFTHVRAATIAAETVEIAAQQGAHVPKAALEALARGDMLEAVKIMQGTGGLGLKQALAAVEAHKRQSPRRIPTVAAGDSRSGWLWIAVLLAAATGAYFWLA
jgi:ribosomal protein L7/L12